jgi:hypothetical protein
MPALPVAARKHNACIKRLRASRRYGIKSHRQGRFDVPEAEKILDVRNEFQDGTLLVIRVWSVPAPVPPSVHRFKYSIFFGRPGVRLVLFDNERGKGDHKHIREVETPYYFESVEKLTADFLTAVRVVQAEEEGR